MLSVNKKEIIIVPPFSAMPKVAPPIAVKASRKKKSVPVVVTEDVETRLQSRTGGGGTGPALLIPVSSYFKAYTVTVATTFPSLRLPNCARIELRRTIMIAGTPLTITIGQRPNVDYIVNADGTFRFVNSVLQTNDEVLLYWQPSGFGD